MIQRLFSKMILLAAFTLSCFYPLAQKSIPKFIILDSITAKHESTTICGKLRYDPVEVKEKRLLDSLKTTGIDTLLLYRHMLGTNGVNGYGKLVWYDKGVLKQFRINFIAELPYYGIKSINYSVIKSDSILRFYFKNHIQSIDSNPVKQGIWMSHDANHFIYVETNGVTYCFEISGEMVRSNPENLRVQLVRKLMIDPIKYVNEIYKKGKD